MRALLSMQGTSAPARSHGPGHVEHKPLAPTSPDASAHTPTPRYLEQEAEAQGRWTDVSPDQPSHRRKDGVGQVIGADRHLLEKLHGIQLVCLRRGVRATGWLSWHRGQAGGLHDKGRARPGRGTPQTGSPTSFPRSFARPRTPARVPCRKNGRPRGRGGTPERRCRWA